jgi:TatD DNase family protein
MARWPDDSMIQFVDSHAHLDGSEFDGDRDAVIERARAAGLRYLLVIGGANGLEQMGAALNIAENHEWIYAAAGIHPHEASKAQDPHFDLVQRLAQKSKFLAVGEIGLDYYYDHSPREVQKKVLVRQLDLAREVKLPIIVHCRDAWPDLREIIRTHWRDGGLGGILHCFSGTRGDAFELIDWRFLVSFAGNLTFKKADDLRAVASEIPLDRLLTETDCPYLAPVPYRGKRNEPAYVAEVTRELARLHNLSEEAMGQRVVENFVEFFRLGR